MKTNFKMKRILSKVLAFTIVASLFTSAANVSAATYSYTPILDENFDDGEIANTSWGNQWLPATFDDEDGRGKVWTIPFGKNTAKSAANGYLDNLAQYMTGDKNYIKFDFKTGNCYNFTFMPMVNNGTSGSVNLSTSKNGWMYANKFEAITQAGLANNQNVLDANTKDSINAGTAWRNGSDAYDYAKDTWYTVMFLFDKINNKISVYLNDSLLLENTVGANVVGNITGLLIWNHKSTEDSKIDRYMSFDNFQIGTYEELLSVENCTFKNGTAVIEFSDNIDQTSLTKDTIKITGQNGKSVDYAGTYADKKYTCVINNYNSLLEYKITAEGYKGSSDKTGIKFEKTFSGDDYIYTPNMTDTFDNENSTFNWKFSASNVDPVYVDESTRGKVLKTSTKARTNAAADDFTFLSGASGASGNVSKNMTSDKANYIDFDIKFSADTNLTFAPQSIGAGWAQTLPFIFSKNGFIASLGVNGSATQYTGVTKTLMDYPNAKAAVDAGYKAVAINGQDWNNIRMVFDKVSNTASLYVNGVLLDSGNKDSAIISKIDDILIRNCDTTVNDIYIDNFEIGTAEETSLKLVNASGEEVTEFSVNDTVYALVITKNNTAADEVRVVAIASYDETNTMIDIKTVDLTTKAGKFGMVDTSDNISVSASGAKTIKAYLWSDWRSIKPLCQSVGAALKQ